MSDSRLQRSFQTLVLALLGLFLLNKLWNGTVLWYINARFLPLTVIGAFGLLWLAQVRLVNLQSTGEAGHAHGGSSPSTWGLLALALPILLGLLIPPAPLGASAVANKGFAVVAPARAGGSPVQLEMLPTDRTVLDWVRAFNYAADPAGYLGEPADVIGFVYHDPRLTGGEFLLARFTLTCCVADAAAIGMIVRWPAAAELATNGWVRVRGPVQLGDLEGRRIPLIEAQSVEAVPPPDQPYIYN
ncbi:MAG: TIGR03943 family putative permease subunit [Anaerolineales bacterium]